MAGNKNLQKAKNAKNDEFYTQYEDIEKEMNEYYEFDNDVFRNKTILLPCDDPEWSNFTKYFVANFNRFGLKKLISTSYAQDKKPYEKPIQLSLFETESPDYDETKTNSHGKIFTLTRKSRNVNKDDLRWKYLNGDGDFRSEEVKKLRDEADIIITNPPFSLFREFLAWIMEAEKNFAIISNLNSYTYKEVFPLIKNNIVWTGATQFTGGATYFVAPKELFDPTKMSSEKHSYIKNDKLYWRVNGVRWLTNIDHGNRHEKLELMTMEDNLKYNKKLKNEKIKKVIYQKYSEYDAIEVSIVEAIPKDYDGIMGVPVSFFDKYNPEQFVVVGEANHGSDNEFDLFKPRVGDIDIFKRILIRRRTEDEN